MQSVLSSAGVSCFGGGGGNAGRRVHRVGMGRGGGDNIGGKEGGNDRSLSVGVGSGGGSQRKARRTTEGRRGWFKKGRDKEKGDVGDIDSASGIGAGSGGGGSSSQGGSGRRLLGLFGGNKDEASRKRGENMRSVKRRIVGICRQQDDAPVRVNIGFRSRTGWEMIRAAKHNQDCIVVLSPWGPSSHYSMFAVLDGHGRNGHLISLFIAQKVVDALPGLLKTCSSEDLALKKAMKLAQRSLEQESGIDTELSGTTGVFCLMAGIRLFCANVGDSRAVLGRRKDDVHKKSDPQGLALVQRDNISEAVVHVTEGIRMNVAEDDDGHEPIVLSYDHNPARADEKERVVKAGARVDCWTSIDVGDERVWLPDSRIPGLAVTRSFGDKIVKKFQVYARPEITQLTLSRLDRFLIIGSDGLWDYISNEETIEFVASRRYSQTPQAVAEALVKEAAEQWIEKDTVIDDISIIIVYLDVIDTNFGPEQPQVLIRA